MTTITVNKDLCTRCGVCSVVCPMSIIDQADENTLPEVQESKAGMCINCGHCEVSCPSQAVWLNGQDEHVPIPTDSATLSAGNLGVYIKGRRSVRHFTRDPVPRETILQVLDICRYAASGGNGQPVEWLIVHDPAEVHRLAGLTIEWMKTLEKSNHPMSGYIPTLVAAWEAGNDPICREAPHLAIAHIPEGNPVASVDALIALTHFDIAAPAFGIGACWAGFLSMAAAAYEPLQEALALPAGRRYAYSLFFGQPKYRLYSIPQRKPLQVSWR